MMNEPLISVIVPVYKAEPYLRRCLDSIVGQTHRNLEIILVDDGSPDACGAICDEYAAKDGRIRVIHQANGGVSSARNAGLAAATGAWIGWVDSDDWIESTMYSELLALLTRENAQIAQCGMAQDGRYKQIAPKDIEAVFEHDDVFDAVFQELITFSLCDKLFCADCIKKHAFEPQHYGEDAMMILNTALTCDRVAVMGKRLYHYNTDNRSITRSPKTTKHLKGRERLFDTLDGVVCAHADARDYGAFYL